MRCVGGKLCVTILPTVLDLKGIIMLQPLTKNFCHKKIFSKNLTSLFLEKNKLNGTPASLH